MATVIPIVVKSVQGAQSIATATWTMGSADTGIEVALSDLADKSVQAAGDFGGATVTVEGSNDGTNYATLKDPAGNPATFTAAGIKQIQEFTLYVRVTTAGGTDSALTVTLAGRKATPLNWS